MVFFKRSPQLPQSPPDAVVDVLLRIWQIKARSTALLEQWQDSARDHQIRAGLKAQLPDERRHLRLLADVIRQRGGRPPSTLDYVVTRAFALVQAQGDDHYRLCALHRGIKASMVRHCYQLLPVADAAMIEVLQQVIPDDERHMRWADERLRSLSAAEVRDCNALLEKVSIAMEAVWGRPWRQLTRTSHG